MEQQPDGWPDLETVRRAIAGERDAFDRLVVDHHERVFRVAFRLLGNRSDAGEVTQDAFLKVWEKRDTLQKPEAFVGFLLRIANNLALNKRRSRKLRQTAMMDDEETGSPSQAFESGVRTSGESMQRGEDDPVRRLESRELQEKLSEAIASLPEKQRLALLMFTQENRPQKEIADELGYSVEAVKWHVFQARKKLKEMLGDVM